LPQIGEAGPSVSAARSSPVARSNVQPWYGQEIVPGNCWLPSLSGTPRCGHLSFSAYAVPRSLINTMRSPSNVMPFGFPVSCEE
jgi:hypothetical protein